MSSRHLITLKAAKRLTKEYREKKKKILKEEYGSKNTLPISETFDRDIVDAILGLDGCVGLRFYFSMNEAEEVGLVLVGVNSKNEDILPVEVPEDSLMMASDTIPVGGGGSKCPTDCPATSALYP